MLLLQLRHPDMQVVVKLAGPEAWMASSFERTAMLHRLVAMRTSVPLPEIIATNMSFRAWPWRYLVMAYNPGLEFARIRRGMSAEELSEMHRQIGAAVVQLQAIQFPAFGELVEDGSVQDGGEFLPANLRYSFSEIGGWLSCLTDDVARSTVEQASGYPLGDIFDALARLSSELSFLDDKRSQLMDKLF